MLSEAVRERLIAAKLAQPDYAPSLATRTKLGSKAINIALFVGPAAIGKTHLMERIEELDPRFGRVPVFSTRDARPDDDPAMFRLFPHDDKNVTAILDNIDKGAYVQYAVHPTQHRIYGTEPDDYLSEYNMLAALASGVDQFLELPFENKHIIGLSAEPAIWARWFNRRYPAGEDRQKRLAEAIISLDWLLAPEQGRSVTFIKNRDDEDQEVAREIIEAVTGRDDTLHTDARNQAVAMRGWARGALRSTVIEEDNHE